MGVYCPQHISVDNHLKQLMNIITPRGFESEVTGSSSTSSVDTKSDTSNPFEACIINKFLSGNCIELDRVVKTGVVRAYICMDPMFGGGSKSCARVCCAVELCGRQLVVVGLEELEISDLDQVTRVCSALLCAHVRLMKMLMPRVMWKEVPVVIIFEQNTYVNALVDVKNLIEQSLLGSGSLIKFYNKWSHINNKYMLGKHVSAKTKLDMVLSTVSGICKSTLCYCDTVMSLGWAVLSEATKKTNVSGCRAKCIIGD